MVVKEGKVESASCLTQKCQVICLLASTAVDDMFTSLFSGTLKIKEVQFMYGKKAQVEKLCKADGQIFPDDVMKRLELRNDECTAFERHKSQLDAFCRQISGLQIAGKINSMYKQTLLFDSSLRPPESIYNS